jgi:hypothetical protein
MKTFWLATLTFLLLTSTANASMFQGETLDAVANGLALFILFALPIGGIWLFWLIHILPEKVAEKRHHPQKDAIKTLCLLSLLFGGMLWPFAWLWAYTKPVTYKMAYGTEKHPDYFKEAGERAVRNEMTDEEIRHLREELDHLQTSGHITPELRVVRDQLIALESKQAKKMVTPVETTHSSGVATESVAEGGR